MHLKAKIFWLWCDYPLAKQMNLNMGCGLDSWGDVRVDLNRYSWRYRRKTTANVIADVGHLPFRDQTFVNIRCFHVLEHVDNPILAFIELKRVADGEIIIRVPVWHFYSYLIEAISLIYFFVTIPILGVKQFFHQLNEIKRWKQRYSDHKWYIRFKGARINRKWFIPKEYQYKWLKV